MLPKSWKQEIDASIEDTAHSQEKNRERQQEQRDASISDRINALTNQFSSYQQQQQASDESKKSREIKTIWGLFITAGFTLALGVIGVIQAVIFHRQLQVFEATDKTLQKTMIVGQRSYLIFERATVNQLQPGIGIKVGYIVQNIGRSPVYNLKQHLFIGIRTAPVTDYAGIPFTDTSSAGYFGPTLAVREIEGPPFSPEQIAVINNASIQKNSSRLYFIGRTEYKDVFDVERWTDFCFMYLKQTSGVNEFAICDYLGDADRENHERYTGGIPKPVPMMPARTPTTSNTIIDLIPPK